MEGERTIFTILPHSLVSAHEEEDDATDGGQQVRAGQGNIFEDAVIVSSAGAEEGRHVAPLCDFLPTSRCGTNRFWRKHALYRAIGVHSVST